jgi:hypothetical protein
MRHVAIAFGTTIQFGCHRSKRRFIQIPDDSATFDLQRVEIQAFEELASNDQPGPPAYFCAHSTDV